MFKDSLPSDILTNLIKDGFVELKGQDYSLTEKGLDEKNRLCTLSGLNIMYSSEKAKKVI
jgi:predicted transcriptional regulator